MTPLSIRRLTLTLLALLPAAVRAVRSAVPAALAIDALAAALRGHVGAVGIAWRLGVTLAIGVVALAVAGRLLRRAVQR